MRELAARLFRDEFCIRAQTKVEHLLTRLASGRELLSVIPLDEQTPYASMLLAVDREHGHLIIDELNPDRGNVRLAQGMPVSCLGRADGVYVGFRSHLLERIIWEGYGALRIAYPDTIQHLQRRALLRVVASATDIGQVELVRRGARAVFGQCLDLSGSGMRVRIASPTDFAMTEGEMLPQIRFSLGGADMLCEAQVRFIRQGRGERERLAQRTLGLRFVDLPPALEQRILSYVQRRDRELLRDGRL